MAFTPTDTVSQLLREKSLTLTLFPLKISDYNDNEAIRLFG